MIMFSVYLVLGLALESLALITLVQGTWSIFTILALHLIASLCIISGINQFRHAYRSYNYSLIIMLFMFIFFVPVFGIISSFVIARWLCLGQRGAKMQSIRGISLNDPLKPMRNKYGVSGLRVHLQSQKLPLLTRVKALKTLSTMPANKSNDLIRTVLPDQQDELRLLAFKLIEQQEKKIVRQINDALILVEETTSENDKAKIYKWLALEYWELVRCSLIEPVMLNFVLNETIHYIDLAKIHLDSDPTLWYLLGRIYLLQSQYQLAIEVFEQAIKQGYLKDRIIPYLAEAYFYLHQYHETKYLLSSVNSLGTGQISHAIITFWSVKNA